MRRPAKQGAARCIGNALRCLKRGVVWRAARQPDSLCNRANCASDASAHRPVTAAGSERAAMQGTGGYGAAGVPSGPVQVRRWHGRGRRATRLRARAAAHAPPSPNAWAGSPASEGAPHAI